MKSLAPLLMCCALVTWSCDKEAPAAEADKAATGSKDAPAVTAATGAKEGDKEPAEKPPGAAPAGGSDIEGTYTSDKVTLEVSGLTPEGFEFSVESPLDEKASEEDDPCGGLAYKGTAKRDAADPNKATTEFEGTMQFKAEGVHFEPSDSMIGNDCMRRIDVEFKRAAK